MRVIAGSAKGTRLKALRGKGVRPTLDRVKEAIFNIIGERVVGARVLDLFAGSGALGIEALSRGADEAIFVEKEGRLIKVIQENLSACHLEERGRLFHARVEEALKFLERQGERFDLILMDPPYGMGIAPRMVNDPGLSGLLSKDGLVVVEHDPREEMVKGSGRLHLVDARRYGDTAISLFMKYKGV